MVIDWAKVSAELKAQIEQRLPHGATLANVKFSDARILSIEPVTALLGEDLRVAAEMERAGGPPMVTNGKPTIMRVVAWLAHEGINKNRLAFTQADLTQAAAKIKEPDFLPMDFNHSAIAGYGWDQKAIGVWYRAEMAQDPKADNAWGILTTGMMWSWMNPTLADTLLAEQARNGRMDFSMACITGGVTMTSNDDGPYEIANDTTFFTLSALDVPPADPAATGRGIEGSDDPNLEESLKKELKGDLATAALVTLLNPPDTSRTEDVLALPNGGQMEALLAQLKELSENAAKIADANIKEAIVATLDAKLAEFQALLEKANQDTVTTDELLSDDAEDQIKLWEAKVADAETARDAALTELAKANTEIARLTTELEASTAALATYRATEAQLAAETKIAARVAELPASYVEAFGKRPAEEQEKSKARWTSMDDEQWASFKADIGLAAPTKSYLARSQQESRLPLGGSAPTGTATRERLSQFRDR